MATTSEKRWLHELLQDIINVRTVKCYPNRQRRQEPLNYNSLLMEIPVQGDNIEVPIFLIPSFIHYQYWGGYYIGLNKVDSIVTTLRYCGARDYYKTAALNLRQALKEDFCSARLMRVNAKIDRDSTVEYYATCGAIFDKYFNPLMMFTYDLHGNEQNESHSLELNRIILRIDPRVMLYKESDVEKFIVNKILTKLLATQLRRDTNWTEPLLKCDSTRLYQQFDITASAHVPIEIIINNLPFKTRLPNSPNTEIENKELLDIALNHIEGTIE